MGDLADEGDGSRAPAAQKRRQPEPAPSTHHAPIVARGSAALKRQQWKPSPSSAPDSDRRRPTQQEIEDHNLKRAQRQGWEQPFVLLDDGSQRPNTSGLAWYCEYCDESLATRAAVKHIQSATHVQNIS